MGFALPQDSGRLPGFNLRCCEPVATGRPLCATNSTGVLVPAAGEMMTRRRKGLWSRSTVVFATSFGSVPFQVDHLPHTTSKSSLIARRLFPLGTYAMLQ